MDEITYSGKLDIPENVFENQNFKELWTELVSKNDERLTINNEDKTFHIKGEIKGLFSKGFESILNQRLPEGMHPVNAELQYVVKEYMESSSRILLKEKGAIKISSSGFAVKVLEDELYKVIAPPMDIPDKFRKKL